MSLEIDPLQVKRDSERIITDGGGRILDWLPIIETKTPRSQEEIVARALVLNALLNIHFKAPIPVIRDWIETNGLSAHLVASERAVLAKTNAELTEQEDINLYWLIEGVWTFLWAGNFIPDLPYSLHVGDQMASLVPDLEKNETGAEFARKFRLRSYEELYRMLDLYYRLHWYARDGSLRGYPTGNASLDIISERRKALEWMLDASNDWDHVQDGT